MNAPAIHDGGVKEFALVLFAGAALAVAMTYPTGFELGRVGRVDKGDGQLSIWNVAWVARTLVVDPRHVFDANIFYPHRGTLAYSENNLGAGALAIPVYWATRNPYAAHNFVMLLSFVLSGAGMYYLVRYLTGDRRAPARFGLIVGFGLSVLAGVAVAHVFRRVRQPAAMAAALVVVTAGELAVPMHMPSVPPVEPVYRTLATLPRGPVIEMPFFYPQVGLFQHTKYMLASTAHWMPMVNGYSDYIPPDFYENVMTLAPFPSRPAFKILEPNAVRYAVFHMYGYNTENRNDVLTRLKEFEPYLRPLYMDDTTRLYEIVGFPK